MMGRILEANQEAFGFIEGKTQCRTAHRGFDPYLEKVFEARGKNAFMDKDLGLLLSIALIQ